MEECKRHKGISGASEFFLHKYSSNEFLGAPVFLITYHNSRLCLNKIVKQMLETPAEIVSNINATSSVQFEMAFKIFNKNEQIYTNT